MKCDKSDLSSTGAISNGVIEYNGDVGWDGGRGYGGRGRARGRGRSYRGRGRGYGGGDMQQEYVGYNDYSGSGAPPAQGRCKHTYISIYIHSNYIYFATCLKLIVGQLIKKCLINNIQ